MNRTLLWFGLGLGLANGCSARRAQPEASLPASEAVGPVKLDGVVVRAEPDPLTHLSIYDAAELFHIAREMDRKGRKEDAITVYESLLEDFPDSGLTEPSWFNLGLLYEGLERFGDAADAYYTLASQPLPDGEERRRTWIDAHFRLAVAFGKLDEWWRAVAMFDRVLALDFIDDGDRIEAMLGRGIAIQEAGEPASAEIVFASILRFAREADRRGPFAERGMVAEAAYRMGEISADRYQAVILEFPVSLLKERLEEKCTELLSAQHRFLRAIRHGDAHTVAAAGYRIGHLYESLYETITALETPAELDADQTSVYQVEVRKRVNILVEKALRIYEKVLVVGRSASTAELWNGRLQRAIERLRDLYLAGPESPVATREE